MNEYWFEIEYIVPLCLASTRIKAVGFQFAHNLQDEAPELVFYGKDSQPVFTHQGLPNIIKSIHFVKEEVLGNELLSPGVIIKNVFGDTEHASTSEFLESCKGVWFDETLQDADNTSTNDNTECPPKSTTSSTDDEVFPF